jgi:very-short-patch-repair endonuclease
MPTTTIGSTRRRDTDLLALGYTTIRLTWRQVVNDPTWVTDRLATVLRR